MTHETSTSLVVNAVSKSYPTPEGAVTVLDGVSFTARAGETIAIVGPSGSGKSTLLHLLGALDSPTTGSIGLGEIEVTALTGDALAHYRATCIGFVFQDHHLLPQLTALENVLLPTLATGVTADAETRAQELLTRVGVAHRAQAFPAQMSGGERQRVAIARALINGATLLLCDEPTGNLDSENGRNIIELLSELAATGVTVIMVTHNTEHAARFARRLELTAGRLAERANAGGGAQ